MSDTTYNGWRNYPTWVTKLWMDNDQGSSEYWNDIAKQALEDADCDKDDAANTLAQMLEDSHDETMPELDGVYADLMNHALGQVDWREIADNLLSDFTVYAAGWNMPGYMPDNPPAAFVDADDALEYIRDAARDALSEMDGMNDDERQAAEDDIDSWKADKNGEFGCTLGDHHYFVSIGE